MLSFYNFAVRYLTMNWILYFIIKINREALFS